ncbi:guanylate kinase [Anaerosacchariphilus polymeriproducens]|uniref:Guanylate kinase n=1 Tax=Anaerosacchariphilus polymeriproducens TaxID=1812858 RepID=A0A371AZ31_9FIRM|nr:guanylate kinase [Anaerosacchariphilus polymeriproducens]RDU24854.1 guanylate kinase [Anaerosacchariphilus polymeriproducens]
MNEQGVLVIVSGFSGAGKGTLVKELMNKYPDQYALSISVTTRRPREGELHGNDYFFVSQEEFQEMISKDELIEYAQYVDNYYGTPKKYVYEKMKEGKDVILEIEIQGALKVKEKYQDAILLFVTPPNAIELKNRLVGRGTEDMNTVVKRFKRGCEEAEGIENYDYLVVNDKLEDCVSKVHSIIQNEHSKAFRNKEYIKKIIKELNNILEGEI